MKLIVYVLRANGQLILMTPEEVSKFDFRSGDQITIKKVSKDIRSKISTKEVEGDLIVTDGERLLFQIDDYLKNNIVFYHPDSENSPFSASLIESVSTDSDLPESSFSLSEDVKPEVQEFLSNHGFALVSFSGVALGSLLGGGSSGGASAPDSTHETPTIIPDTTAPRIQSLSLDATNQQITLTYDEPLDADNPPAPTDFTVTVGSSTVETVNSVAVSGNQVVLSLRAGAFSSGDSVNVDYADPSAGNDTNSIQDAAGNDAVSFSTGTVVDGYIRGAQLYLDRNDNGIADDNERLNGVETDENGKYILSADQNPEGYTLIAKGGVNTDTGIVNTNTFKATADTRMLSPMTTLVQELVHSGKADDSDSASTMVASALGLTLQDGENFNTYDPIAVFEEADSAGNDELKATALAVQKAAVQVVAIMAKAVENSAPEAAEDSENAIIESIVEMVSTAVESDVVTVVDLSAAETVEAVVERIELDDAVIDEIKDAVTEVKNSDSLEDIRDAQAEYLDEVAPKAATRLMIDDVTNDTTPTIRVYFDVTSTDGSAVVVDDEIKVHEAGSTTELHDEYKVTISDMVNGYADITLNELSTEQEYTLAATIMDRADNTSGESTEQGVFTLDTTAPNAPEFSLNADTGNSSSDSITNDNTINVTLSGNADNGDQSSWEYSLDGGTNWNEGSGTRFELANDTAYAVNDIRVRQTDSAGNTSPEARNDAAITTDNSAPAAPTFTLPANTGAADNGITQNQTVTLAADSERATWEYSTDGGTNWQNGSGSSFELAANATYAVNAIQVRQYDTAGNRSDVATNDSAITIDNTSPGAPTFALATDTGSSDSDQITRDLTVNVTLSDGGVSWEYSVDNGSNWDDGSGDSFELAADTQYAAGAIQVRQTDGAGNVSAVANNAQAITTDTSAPAAPSLALNGDTGSNTSDNITSNRTIDVTLSGDAADGDQDRWEYSLDSGNSWNNGSGSSFQLAENATYSADQIQIRQTDEAGNVSQIGSNDNAITIDSTALAAPSLSLNDDTGSSDSDGITSDRTVNVTLDDEAVQWRYSVNGGTNWTQGTDSSFQLDANTSYNVGQIQVQQIDAAGNISDAAENSSAITVDTTALGAPSLSFTDSGSDTSDNRTNDLTVTVTLDNDHDRWQFSLDNGSTWTEGNGSTFNLGANSTYASGAIQVRQYDVAGNVSDNGSNGAEIVTDTTAPSAPTLSLNADTGTSDSDDITNDLTVNVVLSDDMDRWEYSLDSGSSWTAGSDTSFELGSDEDYTANQIQVRQYDVAGNVSDAGSIESAITTDSTAPADPGLSLQADTGRLDNDNITNNLTMNVSLADDAQRWEYQLKSGGWVVGSGSSFELEAGVTYAANEIEVRESDAAGNVSNITRNADTITTDRTAPAAPTFALVSDTGSSDSDNISSSGTIEVTLANDADSWEYSLNGGSSWTTGTNSNRFDLADNTTYDADDIRVRQTDIAGNTSPEATNDSEFRTDSTAPEITDASFSFGDILNAAEDDTNAELSVTTSGIEDGRTVTLTLNGKTYTGTVTDNAATVSSIPSADLQALKTGNESATISFDIDVSDSAGNAATQYSSSFEYNTSQPAITSTGFNFGSELNATEDDSDGTLTINTTFVEDGQVATLTLNNETYSATIASNSATFTVTASILQNLSQGNHEYTVEVSNAAGTSADTLTDSFTRDSVAPQITNATFDFGTALNAEEDDTDRILTVTTDGVENGEAVTLRLNGNDYSGTVSNNSSEITVDGTDLRQLSEGDNISYTVNVSDLADNAASEYTGSFAYDRSAPSFTAGAFSFGTELNAIEEDSAATLSITTTDIEDGVTATLRLDNTNYTAEVNSGSATFTVGVASLRNMAEGEHSYTINVSDSAGNPAPEQTGTFTKDSQAPEITAATFDFGTHLIANEDDSEATLTVTISGAEDGRPVTLTLNDKTYSANVSGTSASITVPTDDLQALPEGDNEFSVTVSDAAGNAATAFEGSFTRDSGVPEITSTSFDFGDELNAVEDNSEATLSVQTSGVEDGRQVSLSLGSETYTGEVSGNAVDITVPADDLDDLTAGTVEYTVTVSDEAGNEVSATDSFVYDATAPTAPTSLALNSDTGTVANVTSDLTMNVTLSGESADQASWEYRLKNGNWVTGSGNSFELDDNTSYAVGEIRVRQTDSAGNVSAETSNENAITTDSTAPAEPSLALATDNGSDDSDGITSDRTINVTLAGESDDQASWSYRLNGGDWQTGSGSSFELGANETYDAGDIEVRQLDGAGNESSYASNTSQIQTDTDAPESPDLTLVRDTGASGNNTDGITNNLSMRVTLKGSAADSDSWQYQLKGGSWTTHTGTTFQLEENTTYAVGEIRVRQVDSAGNISAETSNDAQIVTDNTAPTAPTFALATDTGSDTSDNVTSDRTITVTLTGDADDRTVWQYKLKDADWANGSASEPFSFELDADTEYGVGEIRVRQIDSAGNISEERSNTQRITTDNQGADAPSFSLANDTGSSGSDNITNDQTVYVTLSEVADDRASWQYSTNGGTDWTTGTGTSFELNEGTYNANAIRVRQIDSAGNESAVATNSAAITVDLTALSAPTFALAEDTDVDDTPNTDNVTSNRTMNVTLSDDQVRWEYSLDSGSSWTDGSGTAFELAADTAYAADAIQVRQYDAAGNVSSAASNSNAITTDNTAPAAPTFRMAEASDTGTSNSDNISQNNTVTVTLASDQAKWQYSLDSGSTWTDGSGTTFDLAANTEYAANQIAVRQIDAAGNISDEATNADIFKTDTTAPEVSSVSFSFGTTLNSTEAAAESSAEITTSGVEAGETVTLRVNGQDYTGTVAANNVATITLPDSAWTNLATGTVTYTVNASDAAGNGASPFSGNFEYNTSQPTISSTGFNFGSELNATEDDSNGTLTITTTGVENGRTATLRFNDDDDLTYTAEVTDNSATFTLTPAQLQTLSAGENSYTVNVSNLAENAADELTGSVIYDQVAPSITASEFNFGSVLNSTEDDSDGILTVTTSGVENGNDVRLTLNNKTYTGTVSDTSASITVDAADLAALTEGTVNYTLAVSDTAGNAAASGLTGNFSYDRTPPAADATVTELLTADTSPTITGTFNDTDTTLSSVTVNSVTYELSDDALSVSDGDWTLVIPDANALNYGHYDVEVIISDAAGNTTSETFDDVVEVEQGLVEGTEGADTFTADSSDQTPHLKGGNDTLYLSEFRNATTDALRIGLVSESGGVQTYGIYVISDHVADSDDGLGSVDIELSFSTDALTYQADSDEKADNITELTSNEGDGTVSFGAIATPRYTDYDTPIVTFNVTPANADAVLEFTFDSITINNVDKESFTVSTNIGDGGANKVIFEPTASENGLDEIYGFTVDSGSDENDTIEIHHVDLSALRGNGEQAENLASGATLGTNTGFVVLRDALNDLASNTVQTAALAFEGEANGDIIYLLTTDGTDSRLARVSYENDSATVEFLAEFVGLGELSSFDQSNIYEFTLSDNVAPTIDEVSFNFGPELTAEEDDNNGIATIRTTGVEDGQTVTLTVAGTDRTATINNNSATITILASDLQGLNEGTINYSANVSDAAGNAATEVTGSFEYDATVPSIDSASFNFDSQLNATEDDSDGTLTVSTTGVEDGQTITLSMGGNSYDATVNSNSATISVPAADLQGLTQGTVNYTITVSDAAGNNAPEFEGNFSYDSTVPGAPTVELAVDTGASDSDGFTNNQTVNVGLSDDNASWEYSIDGGSTWNDGNGDSFELPDDDVTYDAGDIQVRQTDTAGNESAVGSNSNDIIIDTEAPSASSIDLDVANQRITINYDAALDADNEPDVNAFTVTKGNNVSITIDRVEVSGQTVTLTLANNSFESGDSVNVAYEDPSSNDDTAAIQDQAGNDASDFSTGKVADGYIRGAQLYLDADGDGVADAGEILQGVLTDETGSYLLEAGANPNNYNILATGGVNTDTGIVNTQTYTAAPGAALINPLTTLIRVLVSNNSIADEAAANQLIASALGSFTNIDLTNYDPLAAGDSNAASVQSVAVQLVSLLGVVLKDVDAASTGTLQQQILENLAGVMSNASGAVDLTSTTTLTALGNGLTGLSINASMISTITTVIGRLKSASSLDDIKAIQSEFLDEVNPDGPTAVTNESDAYDSTPTLAVSLEVSSTDGTAAVAGDRVVIFEGSTELHSYTLTSSDIENGSAQVTLPELSRTGDFTLEVYITDQANRRSTDSTTITFTHENLITGTSGNDSETADDSQQVFDLGQGNDTVYLSEFRNTSNDALRVQLIETSDAGVQTYGVFVVEAHVENATNGLGSLDFQLGFSTDAVTYVDNSGAKSDNFASTSGRMTINDNNAASSGTVSFSGFSAPRFTDYDNAVVTFQVTPDNADDAIEFNFTNVTVDGDGTKEDITVYTNVGNGGTNTFLFDADPDQNGDDNLYGFTLGEGESENDSIAFDGLQNSTLRGSGSDAQILTTSGTLGNDVGFAIITDALDNLEEGTIETAALGLEGENNGDVIYLMATDGADARLAEVTYGASDASIAFLATFHGIGSLNSFDQTNLDGFTIV